MTTESLSSQVTPVEGNSKLEIETSTKLTDALYSSKPSYDVGSPNSLRRMISKRRPSFTTVHSAFMQNRREKQKQVNFEVDYGYGDDSVQEPPVKRRRFQRRNSKTPRMLMGDSGALVRDTLRKLDEVPSLAPKSRTMPFLDIPSGASTDSYLNIVEDIVSQVQKRRRSSKSA